MKRDRWDACPTEMEGMERRTGSPSHEREEREEERKLLTPAVSVAPGSRSGDHKNDPESVSDFFD